MRCFVVEYQNENKAVFGCPNGHTWKDSLVPKAKRGRIGESGLRFLAVVEQREGWSDDGMPEVQE